MYLQTSYIAKFYLIALILAAHAVAEQDPSTVVPAADATTVPMLSQDGRPAIKVGVNGRGRHDMVLDTGLTGSTMVILSPGWVGGRTEQTRVQLQIGALTFSDLAGWSLPMPSGFPKGVVSAEAFPGELVTLNFPMKAVVFQRGSLPPADGRRIFQYEGDRPSVPIRIAGVEAPVRVDTGNPEGLTLPLRLSARTPLAGRPVAAGQGQGIDTDGNATKAAIFKARVAGTVELGEYTLDTPILRFSDEPAPWPGNIGDQILRTFKLTIDARNRRLLFER